MGDVIAPAGEQRAIENLQRRISAELLSSLSQPDTPKQFWHRLDRILRWLESRGVCASCALYVQRRHRHLQYTCKAASRHVEALKPQPVHADEHPGFRDMLALPEGIYESNGQPLRPPLDLLLGEPDRSHWVMHYPDSFAHDTGPLFFAIAALEPPQHGAAASRAAAATLTHVFTEIFAVARAIFAVADHQRLDQERLRIFSAATHDMLAPVASLRQYAEGLTGLDGMNAECQQHILRLADEAILRIQNALHEWWSKGQQPPELSTVDPSDVMSALVDQVRAHRPELTALLSSDAALEGYALRAHEPSLNMALKNVLDNAIKFGKGAPVHVKLRAVDDGGDPDAGVPPGRKLVIEIRDHGIGIPVDCRRTVFDYGYRTPYSRKHVVRGAGVGLSITKAIVESHGGNIWVDTAVPPSAGTSMVIALPLHRRS